jgi:hypothetical protein
MMEDDEELNETVRVSVRMTRKLKKYFESFAKENNMTLSEFIRNVLIWFQMGILTHQIEVPAIVKEFNKRFGPINEYVKKKRVKK